MPLQKLVGNIYSVFVEVALWIIPIIGAISFYYLLGKDFVWVILGIIAGLVVDVLLFGPIVLLFNIRALLKSGDNGEELVNVDKIVKPYTNKQCKKCYKIYDRINNNCPNCGSKFHSLTY